MAFREFVRGLRGTSILRLMKNRLSRCCRSTLITKPVFEALFEGYSFVQNNAVSMSMQKALDAIEAQAIEDVDAELLRAFINQFANELRALITLKVSSASLLSCITSFSIRHSRRWSSNSVSYTRQSKSWTLLFTRYDVLQKEFGRSLSDENVNILDPFTGTGTFMTRLLQHRRN